MVAPPDSSRIADKLMADVNELNSRINGLVFPPEVVVGGAAALMEEVAATKISGEEDRYSRTDLWDFQANSDGSKKSGSCSARCSATISAMSRRSTPTSPPSTRSSPTTGRGDGFASYEKLTDADRIQLSGAVNTLAEDLSQLRASSALG